MDYYEGLVKSIKSDISDVNGELQAFVENHDLHELSEPESIRSSLGQLADLLGQLDNEQIEKPNRVGLQTLAAANSAIAQLDSLDSVISMKLSLGSISKSISATWANLKSYLENKIKGIAADLWRLISGLLNLKEWSVSGETGVSLFGLSGKVQIELTFEP